MSEDFLKIVPANLHHVPDSDAVRVSTTLLKSFFPNSGKITFKQWEGVQFVDQGCYFERVSCPNCESTLDLDWWGDLMSSKWNEKSKRFESLDIETPCCTFKTSLNDLKYEMPAAFGRCTLEVMSPNRDLNNEELRQIERAMGCPVRKILARY
jgi:hypothetical protein